MRRRDLSPSLNIVILSKVLDLIRKCDGLAQYLLQYRVDYKISAREVLAFLKPSMAHVGNQRKANEEVVLSKFVEFMQCLEGMCYLAINYF
jgi:hypothetical protein